MPMQGSCPQRWVMLFFFLFKVRIVVLLKYPFPLCQNNIPKPLFPFQRSGIRERCKIQEGARQRRWQPRPFSPPCSPRSHAKNNPQEAQLCSESRQRAESERPARGAAPGRAQRPAPRPLAPHFPCLAGPVNPFGAAPCRPPVAAERATHLAPGPLRARAKPR